MPKPSTGHLKLATLPDGTKIEFGTAEQIREEAFVLVQDFPRYEEFKPYYDAAFEEHHGMAFDQSYEMGGRRSGSKFDSDKYVAILVALIERDAAEDGHAEIAESLVLYRGLNGLPAADLP